VWKSSNRIMAVDVPCSPRRVLLMWLALNLGVHVLVIVVSSQSIHCLSVSWSLFSLSFSVSYFLISLKLIQHLQLSFCQCRSVCVCIKLHWTYFNRYDYLNWK
jgi:hypothetical protein